VFLANEPIRARAADAAVQSRGTLKITLGDCASPTIALSTLAQGTLGARDCARLRKQGCSTVCRSLLRCCPLDYFAAVPTSVRPPHLPAPQSAHLYTLRGLLPCRRHLHSRQATAASSQSRPPAHTRASTGPLYCIHTLIALCAPRPQPLRSSPYRPLLPVSRERTDLRIFAADRSAVDSRHCEKCIFFLSRPPPIIHASLFLCPTRLCRVIEKHTEHVCSRTR